MPPRPRPLSSALAAACSALLTSGAAHAEGVAPPTPAAQAPTPSAALPPQAAAAAAFDDGVTRFEHADYAAAARAFLLADELVPNPDALTNAIAAARRGNDHLLVAEAAERGLQRAEPTSPLAAQAREALAQAARSLVRLELFCAPAPCSLTLDGDTVQAGGRYLLPGTHSGAATGPDGAHADDRWTLVAGATYRVTLQVPRAEREVTPPQSAPGAPRETEALAAADRTSDPEPRTESAPGRPLPRGAFYVGVGVTGVLAGVLTWSGLDALSRASAYKGSAQEERTLADRNAVQSAQTRSDVLLGATLVAAGATAALGLFLVDWGGGEVSAGVTPTRDGAVGALHGTF